MNLGAAGRQLRLAQQRGPCGAPCTGPIYSYPHNGRDASVTGGFVYHGTQFPSVLPGQLLLRRLHAELDQAPDVRCERQRHRRLQLRAGRRLGRRPYGDIVYLTEGPDGALYYVDLGYSDIGGTFGVSKIRRIRYVQSNQAPVAVAAARPDLGPGTALDVTSRAPARPIRRAAADLLVDVRRRRDLHGCQPDPHLHVQAGDTRPG